MAKISLPYVKWRDGRPRFEPSPRERELGFSAQDLKHPNGAWFTFEEAKAFADNTLPRIYAAREAGRKIRPQAAPRRTVEALLEDWMASRAVTDLAPSTQRGYRTTVNAIVYKPDDREALRKRQRAIKLKTRQDERERETFATTPVEAIEPPEAYAFIDYLIDARGRHMGRACRATLQAAFEWGRISTTWRLKTNPFARLKFKKPDGRIVIYTDAEIRALVDAADAIERPSIGDGILLGLFTGQRQGDRLSLVDGGVEDGRRIFRQNKTGAVVAIPEMPRLAQRLAEARVRVAAVKLRIGTRPNEIVVNEATGLAYLDATYRSVFNLVRAHAAKTCPALAEKRDQDLRDTCVTWLARAGCTIPEICSITGHDAKSVYSILKHYLAITPELADSAIGKLEAFMQAKGMAV